MDVGPADIPAFGVIAGLRSTFSPSVAENMPLIIAEEEALCRAGFDLGVMPGPDRRSGQPGLT
jgi:hypothetical protein